jgi:uncharacterized protein (TIGR02186 family)
MAAAGPPARAQEAEVAPVEENGIPERIEIGLSTDTIAITSDFSGVDLTIFGAVDNIDPLIQRQGRYDVFVVLDGPPSNIVLRRKGRVAGIWMNVDAQPYLAVPESFLIASTRQSQDVTDLGTIARLSLSIGNIRLRPVVASRKGTRDVDEFTEELRRLKEAGRLYQEFPSGVRFISQSLFRAKLSLPANVPLGRHLARAYLFRQGQLVAQTQANLDIRKAGLEYRLFQAAQNQSLLYGIGCVALALFVGWFGRLLFRRD